MGATSSVSLANLIDEALSTLYRSSERPLQVKVGATALSTVSATQLTLSTAEEWDAVQVSDILENGQELLLVTGKSADATPVFTVSRGYAATTPAVAATGAVLRRNPLWPRSDVQRAVLRAFSGPMSTYLPAVKSATLTTVGNRFFVEVPAECVKPFRVAIVPSDVSGSASDYWVELAQWDFVDDVPSAISSTGKMITFAPVLPKSASGSSTLYVTYQKPYTWTTSGTAVPASEADTIDVPLGAEDIPPLYAAAYLVAHREVSRLELDKVEEWNREEADRQGVNVRMVAQLWSEVYRRIDESRRLQHIPRHRPYRKLRRA